MQNSLSLGGWGAGHTAFQLSTAHTHWPDQSGTTFAICRDPGTRLSACQPQFISKNSSAAAVTCSIPLSFLAQSF